MSSYTRDDLIDAWKEGYAQGRDDPFTEEGPSGYGAYHAAAEACADKVAATLRQQAGRVDEGLWQAVDRMIVDAWKLGGCEKTLDMLAMRDRFTAALAQNTQVDGEAVAVGYIAQEDLTHLASWSPAERAKGFGAYEARVTSTPIGNMSIPLYLYAERARVPADMVLVPREPDAEMLDAAIDAHLGFTGEDEVDEVWKAMLAAAPSQRAEVDRE